MSNINENWVCSNRTGGRVLTSPSDTTTDISSESFVNLESVHLLPNSTTAATTTLAANTDSTSINIEIENEIAANNRNATRINSSGQFIRQHLFSLFNEARTHFVQPNQFNNNNTNQTVAHQQNHHQQQQEPYVLQQQNEAINEISNENRAQSLDWRRNLNHILSMSITNAPNFQFTSNTSTDNYSANNLTASNHGNHTSTVLLNPQDANERNVNVHRRSSAIEHNNNNGNNVENATSSTNSANEHLGEDRFFDRERIHPPHVHNLDEDTNILTQILIKVFTILLRYMPFILTLCVKFVHDHILDIVDIFVLQGAIYHMNKSLCEQITKLSQKNYYILFRDFVLVTAAVSIRFHFANGVLDPVGLLISPPNQNIALSISTQQQQPQDNIDAVTVSSDSVLQNSIQITQRLSLSMALFYVIINDLVLKLLTILVKILITMIPSNLIQHKPRRRVYVSVEYLSQFYRAFAPMHQWVTYFRSTHKGLEAIFGILFIFLYLGAKGYEFIDRGKSLKKAVVCLVRNRDTDRKPTERELSAVDVCPICHDSFSSPVVIECGHIFCEDCVRTWLKREQTCPMCRAKVREDVNFQDGSTTSFYQIF